MANAPFFLLLLLVWTIICCAKTAPKFPAILVFGDSTGDSGNNNYIATLAKGNHYPYGQDYPGHIPTGRFSNGKLVPDFIASALSIKESVPPFLDPNLSNDELRTGVSFASGGSGYDDLTTVASAVIPVSKQIDLFKKYIARLKKIVGEEETQEILSGALVIISAGTNDFILNFYDIPTRRLEFNISEYQDFLQNRLRVYIKELYDLGCRILYVAGLPPTGCIPFQITAKFENPKHRKCLEDENLEAENYNHKLRKLLPKIQAQLPWSTIVYADVYEPILDMINHPKKYGFVETTRGCCGTGFIEVGPSCNRFTSTCGKASQYLFWDSFHPSESAYRYISDYLEKELLPRTFQDNHSQS